MAQPQQRGRLYTLWNLFGWFEAAPNNLTNEERKRNLGDTNWNSNALAQYYYSSVGSSSDYASHQQELDDMCRYEIIKPIISLYAEECLTGDTKVPMLNGSIKTIRELYDAECKNGWVYGINDTGRPVAACFEHVKLVRKSAEVIRITWVDSFGKEGSMKVTPDHKMMCLGGKYVSARDLVVGDKLQGLVKNHFKAKGRSDCYEGVFNAKDRKWQTTHRMVSECIFGKIPEGHVVHHKDFNSTNNDPSNLEVMSEQAHRDLHNMVGANNPNYRDDITWEMVYEAAVTSGPATLNDILRKFTCNVKVINRLLNEAGFSSWTDFSKKTFGKKPKTLANHDVRILKNSSKHKESIAKLIEFSRQHPEAPLVQYREAFKGEFDVENTIKFFGFSRWNDFKKHHDLNAVHDIGLKTVNHTITRVEDCPPEDVFDLVNSNPTHNFAAGSDESFVYVSNCTQPDINKGKTIWYKCSNVELERELNDMLERINAEDHIFSIASSVAGTGNCYRRILRNEEGIQQIVAVSNREVERVWEPSTKRLIGFKWQGQTPYSPDDSISYMEDRTLFSPWEFIHFRRIEDNTSEYGVGLIEHLFGTYRKIKMAIDNMVVYRLHTMPTRFMLWIDCGNMTIWEMMNQANQMRNLLRNQVSIDTQNNDMQERYNPPATDSIMFFPFRKEEGHKLEKMEGTRDVPDVHDLDLLFKMLFGGARIPKAYIGFEDDTAGLAKSSLVSQDIRFARMIRVLRRPIVQGFKRLAELHLAFKGLNPSEHTIEVEMSRISSIEEEMNAATMESQVRLASDLTNLCQSLDIPNKEIIDLVFKNYLHVPKEFVEIAKLAAAIEKAVRDNREQEEQDMAAAGMGGGGMPGPGGGVDLGADLMGGAPMGAGAPGGDMPPIGGEVGGSQPMGGGAAMPAAPTGGGAESLFGLPANLLESIFSKISEKYVTSRKVLEEFKSSKNNLLESDQNVKSAHQFVEDVRKTKMHIRTLLELKQARKCSLVESFARDKTPFIDTSYPLNEAERSKFMAFAKKIVESGSLNETKQVHPGVAMVKHMRE